MATKGSFSSAKKKTSGTATKKTGGAAKKSKGTATGRAAAAGRTSGEVDALHRIFLDCSIRSLRQYVKRIEDCVAKLSPEQIWARGGEQENAAGNLVLHLCGNVRQWIVSGVGGQPDIRDRDAEFDARGGVPPAELLERLRRTIDEVSAVLASVPRQRLADRIVVQNYDVSVLEAIYHVVEHFSGHTGQIIFATKMMTGDDLGFYRHLRTAAAHGKKTP